MSMTAEPAPSEGLWPPEARPHAPVGTSLQSRFKNSKEECIFRDGGAGKRISKPVSSIVSLPVLTRCIRRLSLRLSGSESGASQAYDMQSILHIAAAERN